MLVFRLKKNEGFVINDNIFVTVLDFRLDRIEIGIEAPREVEIYRRKVWEERKALAADKEKEKNE